MSAPSKEEIKAAADRAEARSQGKSAAEEFVDVTVDAAALDAEIKKLAALPIGIYESKRVAEARRLNLRTSALDRLVAAERSKLSAKSKKEGPPQFDPDDLKKSAKDVIEGPVAFLVTTTKSKLHPENETRMLSLEIDDSEQQTKSVLGKVAQVDGLNHSAAQVDYVPWQDFQRWLERGERRVVVPFAKQMSDLIPPAAVRLRRDFGQVLRAVKAHALLHRDQRQRDDTGQIVADIDRDYEAVRKLMNAIIAEGSGVAVHVATIETIEAVVRATAEMTEAEGATAKDIAAILKLDKSAARRRLLAACDDDYIVNLESRKGMPGKYRATGQKVEPVNILPITAALREAFDDACGSPLQKPAPPCHRDEIAETFQEDNGGKPPLPPLATDTTDGAAGGTGGSRWQTGLATDMSLDGNEKSPPVARWQRFSGGTDARAHGGSGGKPANGGDDLTIPAFLDVRHEVCAHCGQPGGTEWDYHGTKVRLHARCERSWIEAHEASGNSAMAVVGSSL